MARVYKSLLQNADWGENRQAHREHRSKKGRNQIWKIKSEAFRMFKQQKEELKWGVDKKSLRLIKNKYKI